MGAYKYMVETWRKIRRDPEYAQYITYLRERWRESKTVERVPKPTIIPKARAVGYRAKRGYVVVRVRVRKGGLSKIHPRMGRRPKAMGISKIKRQKSMKQIAEERAQRKFRNLTLIGSYYLGEDGKYVWYEVIMRDDTLLKREGD